MEIGDPVEDFILPDQYGHPQSLYRYLNFGPVILFFYPKAMTKGCSREACHFRDLDPEFSRFGAQRIGISRDSVERQFNFSELYGVHYPLLSDAEGSICARFGVARSFRPRPTRRWTFFIDSDRRLVEIIRTELRVEYHADRALEILEQHKFPSMER